MSLKRLKDGAATPGTGDDHDIKTKSVTEKKDLPPKDDGFDQMTRPASATSSRSSTPVTASCGSSEIDLDLPSPPGSPAGTVDDELSTPPVSPISATYQDESPPESPTSSSSGRGRSLYRRDESAEDDSAEIESIGNIESKEAPVRLSDWVDPKDVHEGRVRVYSPSGREATAEEYENDPERPLSVRERVEGIKERLTKKLAELELRKELEEAEYKRKEAEDERKEAEDERKEAEDERKEAEDKRKEAEDKKEAEDEKKDEKHNSARFSQESVSNR